MRMDTLSCKYKMQADASLIYRVLTSEQLKYFQSQDATITKLSIGTQIKQSFRTKTQSLPVDGNVLVTKMIDGKIFQTQTSYSRGAIVQTYDFKQGKQGVTEVKYSEQNSFLQSRDQFGFMIIGVFYKLIYNRGIKKRLKYIEQLSKSVKHTDS